MSKKKIFWTDNDNHIVTEKVLGVFRKKKKIKTPQLADELYNKRFGNGLNSAISKESIKRKIYNTIWLMKRHNMKIHRINGLSHFSNAHLHIFYSICDSLGIKHKTHDVEFLRKKAKSLAKKKKVLKEHNNGNEA